MAAGGARLTYEDVTLDAAVIRFDQRTGVATAEGGVVLDRGGVRLLADQGTYETTTGRLRLENVRAGQHPLYLSGKRVEGDTREFVLHEATVTYGEPGTFVARLYAAEVAVQPDGSFVARRARLAIGAVPLFYLPTLRSTRGDTWFETSLRAGYRGTLGPYLNATVLLPVGEGTRLGAGLGLFGRRGAMLGPAARYDRAAGEGTARGTVRSGYIRDQGSPGTDVLGRRIPRDRGFFEWRHVQGTDRPWSVHASASYWSDSEIVRDFDRGRFADVQQPDTFFETAWVRGPWSFSAFARARLHDWQPLIERRPELRLDLAPTPLIDGLRLLHRGSAALVCLAERPPGGGPTVASDRFDAYYGLAQPWPAAPWLTFTPVAGARVTHYFDASGGRSDYTRILAEYGLDARARAYAVFEYANPGWDIDGLRHLVEPFASYRRIPRADRGQAYIPALDRPAFATRLQPLGLGDRRTLDRLEPTDTLRLGLDQRLQTRAAGGGSRDLAALVVAGDVRFERPSGTRGFDEAQIDLALHPAGWLRIEAFQRVGLRGAWLREFNCAFAVRDGEVWEMRFGTEFLRGQLEEYALDATVRLNEVWSLAAGWRYDARASSLYEQTYGLAQQLRNLGTVRYQVAWHEGLRRESGFHFRVVLDLFAF